MRTSTLDGPPCVKKGIGHYHISPIFSIPCAPNWVSKTLSVILCSNTVVVFIDTFKHKWIFCTSPHWARLIDTLSRLSKKLSRRGERFDLKTPHSRSREKETPIHTVRDRDEMASLRTTITSHNKISEMRRQLRTRENGVSTIKSLGTKLNNYAPSSHSWSS
jgi:hypothetical protein